MDIMANARINYLIDALLGLSFFITAATSVIIFLFLPSGVRQGGYQEFMGITKSTYGLVHTYVGLLMIGLSLVHLVLHFDWIVCMTKNLFKKTGECAVE